MESKAQKVALVLVLIIAVFLLIYREYIPIPDALKRFIPVQSTQQQTSPTPLPTTGVVVTPAVSATAIPAPTGNEGTVFAAVNARRSEAGALALTNNAALQLLAANHAADMATRNYFSHVTPEGVSFQDRLSNSGYGSSTAAENIGVVTGASPADAVALWMQSDEHRTFLLSTNYRALGIGVAAGTYQGQAAYYVVAVFGDIQ